MTLSLNPLPSSISNNCVSISKNRNTSYPPPTDKIVFFVCTFNKTSPVSVDTTRTLTTTESLLYVVDAPIPNHLAPRPPDSKLVSYPTIPPSTNNPANNKGLNFFFSLNSSLALLIICLSLTSASIFVLSTTLNHSPLPAVLSASISKVSAPCVTAVEKSEKLSLYFLCPVLSKN